MSVQFTLLPSVAIPATMNGGAIDAAAACCGRPVLLGDLPVAGSGPTVYMVTGKTGDAICSIVQTGSQTFLKMKASHGGSCTIVGTKNSITSQPLTITAP